MVQSSTTLTNLAIAVLLGFQTLGESEDNVSLVCFISGKQLGGRVPTPLLLGVVRGKE